MKRLYIFFQWGRTMKIDLHQIYKIKNEYRIIISDGNILNIFNNEKNGVELQIKFKESDNWIKTFFRLLDGTEEFSSIISCVPENKKNVVISILEKYGDKYLESINFFSDSEKKLNEVLISEYLFRYKNAYSENDKVIQENMMKNLPNIKVVLVGIGILGSRILRELLRVSVQNIIIVDEESVSPRDIVWGEYYCQEFMGKPKSEFVKKYFRGYEGIKTEESLYQKNLINTLEDPNTITIIAKDRVNKDELLRINEYLIKHKAVFVLNFIDSEKISIGPTIFPGETACLNCFSENTNVGFQFPKWDNDNSQIPIYAELATSLLMIDFLTLTNNLPTKTLVDKSITIGRQFIIRLKDMEGYDIQVYKDPTCRKCCEMQKEEITL